jgi:S-adenosylmethionine hydrolase
MAIITLTTDFGSRDGYVGAVKGVLARLAPDASLIDIAHDLPRGDIAHAAWIVATSCREFPQGTLHVVVVDPGVGGSRREVVIAKAGMTYVGPDNGVFAYLDVKQGYAIDNPGVISRDASATFHGRDIFAPAAAAIARGKTVDTLGRPVKLAGQLPWGERPSGEGRVVHVDHYGNLITDLPREEVQAGSVAVAGERLSLRRTYEDVAPGELVAYIGSARTVEIAVRDGRADARIAAVRGTRVVPVADRAEHPYR